MDLDLGQVRAFVVVADVGNVTRGAEDLQLSQQAVSKRIARLERVVGPLFVRHTDGVSLTGPGHAFLPSARELLAVADAALAEVRGAPPPALRADVWGDRHPPHALITAFAAGRAELVVEYSMRRSLPQSLAALQRREIDVAFGNLTGLPTGLPNGLAAELVTCTPVAALVSERSPLADRAQLDRNDLGGARLWWPTSGGSPELTHFAHAYASWLGARLVTDGRNTADGSALADAVGSDPATVTFVDAGWEMPAGAGVRTVPLRPAPCYPWYLVWPVTAPHPLTAALVAFCRQAGHRPGTRSRSTWLPPGTHRTIPQPPPIRSRSG